MIITDEKGWGREEAEVAASWEGARGHTKDQQGWVWHHTQKSTSCAPGNTGLKKSHGWKHRFGDIRQNQDARRGNSNKYGAGREGRVGSSDES